LGQGKAQTTAIPVGIARICNVAMAQKTRFYVPDSVQHYTSSLKQGKNQRSSREIIVLLET